MSLMYKHFGFRETAFSASDNYHCIRILPTQHTGQTFTSTRILFRTLRLVSRLYTVAFNGVAWLHIDNLYFIGVE